jgi:hypothetical protein
MHAFPNILFISQHYQHHRELRNPVPKIDFPFLVAAGHLPFRVDSTVPPAGGGGAAGGGPPQELSAAAEGNLVFCITSRRFTSFQVLRNSLRNQMPAQFRLLRTPHAFRLWDYRLIHARLRLVPLRRRLLQPPLAYRQGAHRLLPRSQGWGYHRRSGRQCGLHRGSALRWGGLGSKSPLEPIRDVDTTQAVIRQHGRPPSGPACPQAGCCVLGRRHGSLQRHARQCVLPGGGDLCCERLCGDMWRIRPGGQTIRPAEHRRYGVYPT